MVDLTASSPPSSPAARPFLRSALSARLIGVAALTLGAVSIYALREAGDNPNGRVAVVAFSLMFIVPGMLYFVLATFIGRRKRWAILATSGLAMLDMTLLGVLFVTSWGTPVAAVLCPISGMFVVALAVMNTFLGRALTASKAA